MHLPIKLARALVPSLFPFAFHRLDTITEVPADMLLLHVCLPFTLPHLHIRYIISQNTIDDNKTNSNTKVTIIYVV